MARISGRHIFCFHRCPAVLLYEFVRLIAPLSLLYLWALRFQSALPHAWFLSPYYLSAAYRMLCVLWLLEMLRRYFNDLYVFGQQRIIHFSGRISLRYQRISICYADIREIRVKQSPFGRLFRYGTLHLSTSAKLAGEEIHFRDIICPRELSLHVQRLITRARRSEVEAFPPHPAALHLN